MKKLCAIVALVFASGCAITVDHMSARAFTKDVREAERRANDQIANAKLLLQAGVAAEQVEATLRGNGIDAEQAHHVVEVAKSICSACAIKEVQ